MEENGRENEKGILERGRGGSEEKKWRREREKYRGAEALKGKKRSERARGKANKCVASKEERIETKRRVARDKRRREESSFSTPGQVHASILASFGRECFVQAGIKSRHSFAPLLSRPRTGSLLLASSAPSLARAKDGGKRVAIRDGT